MSYPFWLFCSLLLGVIAGWLIWRWPTVPHGRAQLWFLAGLAVLAVLVALAGTRPDAPGAERAFAMVMLYLFACVLGWVGRELWDFVMLPTDESRLRWSAFSGLTKPGIAFSRTFAPTPTGLSGRAESGDVAMPAESAPNVGAAASTGTGQPDASPGEAGPAGAPRHISSPDRALGPTVTASTAPANGPSPPDPAPLAPAAATVVAGSPAAPTEAPGYTGSIGSTGGAFDPAGATIVTSRAAPSPTTDAPAISVPSAPNAPSAETDAPTGVAPAGLQGQDAAPHDAVAALHEDELSGRAAAADSASDAGVAPSAGTRQDDASPGEANPMPTGAPGPISSPDGPLRPSVVASAAPVSAPRPDEVPLAPASATGVGSSSVLNDPRDQTGSIGSTGGASEPSGETITMPRAAALAPNVPSAQTDAPTGAVPPGLQGQDKAPHDTAASLHEDAPLAPAIAPAAQRATPVPRSAAASPIPAPGGAQATGRLDAPQPASPPTTLAGGESDLAVGSGDKAPAASVLPIEPTPVRPVAGALTAAASIPADNGSRPPSTGLQGGEIKPAAVSGPASGASDPAASGGALGAPSAVSPRADASVPSLGIVAEAAGAASKAARAPAAGSTAARTPFAVAPMSAAPSAGASPEPKPAGLQAGERPPLSPKHGGAGMPEADTEQSSSPKPPPSAAVPVSPQPARREAALPAALAAPTVPPPGPVAGASLSLDGNVAANAIPSPQTTAAATDTPPPAAPVPNEDKHPGARPGGFVAARDGKPDDLKLIRGIGKQNEGRLHGLGIWHFDQIAAWTPENVRWVGSYLAFPGRIDREQWVAQATELAAGHQTAFAKRVAEGKVKKDDGSLGQDNIERLERPLR